VLGMYAIQRADLVVQFKERKNRLTKSSPDTKVRVFKVGYCSLLI
jgi:hypothetical protein